METHHPKTLAQGNLYAIEPPCIPAFVYMRPLEIAFAGDGQVNLGNGTLGAYRKRISSPKNGVKGGA
jgi:hypothetical protein